MHRLQNAECSRTFTTNVTVSERGRTRYGEMDERLDGIQATLTAGGRLDDMQILALVSTTDLISLGMLADDARRRRHGDRTTFARVAVVPVDAIARLEVPGAAGELRVVGAPDSLEVAETVVQAAVAGVASAGIPVSAFSLDDLERLCGRDGVTLERLLERFRVAGLSAVAELPADRMADPVRAIEATVGAGLPVSRVTIREAHGDERLALIRRVAGWTIPPQAVWAFAPLPRTDGGDAGHAPATGYDDVRQVAFARLVVDNIDTIQVDWTLHGPKLGQVALTFGADDVDAVPATDTDELGARRTALEEIQRNIRAAAFVPTERNGCFESVTR